MILSIQVEDMKSILKLLNIAVYCLLGMTSMSVVIALSLCFMVIRRKR